MSKDPSQKIIIIIVIAAHKTQILTCAKGLFLPLVGLGLLSWEEPPDVFYRHSNIINLQDVTTPTADKPAPITKQLRMRSTSDDIINVSRSVNYSHLSGQRRVYCVWSFS